MIVAKPTTAAPIFTHTLRFSAGGVVVAVVVLALPLDWAVLTVNFAFLPWTMTFTALSATAALGSSASLGISARISATNSTSRVRIWSSTPSSVTWLNDQ